MIKDFIDNIWKRQDKKKLSVQFPDCLDQMKTADADFESAISNTIQKLNLYHRSSVFKSRYPTLSSTIGVIFVNTRSLKHKYYTEGLRCA